MLCAPCCVSATGEKCPWPGRQKDVRLGDVQMGEVGQCRSSPEDQGFGRGPARRVGVAALEPTAADRLHHTQQPEVHRRK